MKNSEGALLAESAFILDGDKPNSVPPQLPADLDDHFSQPAGADRRAPRGTLMRLLPGSCPARAGRVRRPALPVLSCTAWGLSCPGACAPGGGLLPRLFTLTRDLRRGRFVFCDTFRRARLSPGAPAHFTRHAALWCSDFPLRKRLAPLRSDHLPAAGKFARGRGKANRYFFDAGADASITA